VIATPKTARGRATRNRILNAASQLIHERGVAETSVDDVIERAGVSKSQLYHFFDDRAALLRAVVSHTADDALGALPELDSWRAIRAWFDDLIEQVTQRAACRGCRIGSLVGQLAETDAPTQLELAAAFERWHAHLRDGLSSMQRAGKLSRRADTSVLATATLAAIQGGFLLAQATRDPDQLAIALDAAYAHLRAHARLAQ
jgi:TetR/AcrR family transcriptional regulator, transcriptional repressor for nem operon